MDCTLIDIKDYDPEDNLIKEVFNNFKKIKLFTYISKYFK